MEGSTSAAIVVVFGAIVNVDAVDKRAVERAGMNATIPLMIRKIDIVRRNHKIQWNRKEEEKHVPRDLVIFICSLFLLTHVPVDREEAKACVRGSKRGRNLLEVRYGCNHERHFYTWSFFIIP